MKRRINGLSVVPQLITVVLTDLLPLGSAGEGEVVEAGNAEHGMVEAVAFQAAVIPFQPEGRNWQLG